MAAATVDNAVAEVVLLDALPPITTVAAIRSGLWTAATDKLCVARAVHPGTARRRPSPAIEMIRRLGPSRPPPSWPDS